MVAATYLLSFGHQLAGVWAIKYKPWSQMALIKATI